MDGTDQKLRRAIAISETGSHYVYKDAESITMRPEVLVSSWGCWEDFFAGNKVPALSDMFLDYYEKRPGKGMNKVDVALMVWDAMFAKAAEQGHIRIDAERNAVDRRALRSKKLEGRKYIIVHDHDLTPAELASRNRVQLPPQAITCLEMIYSEGVDEVTEARMKEVVEEQRGEFRTRQDPWRVFQYYRPQLITNRFVRLV